MTSFYTKSFSYTALTGFNGFGFNKLSRFNESDFDLKYFFTSKNFGFSEYPGLTNGPKRFVKSGDHCNKFFTHRMTAVSPLNDLLH